MTVREFINELEKLPQDSIVVMSKDSEGNNFSPLSDLTSEVYVPESTWSGEIYMARELTKEMIEDGYQEEDCYNGDDAQDAIVLWPVN